MILIIYLLTPFTTSSTLTLFQGFRVIQTRMMVLSVIHGLRPNQKLKSILEGCTDINHLWGSSLGAHNLYAQPFFKSHSVYLRFTHVMNLQPKFYLGSAMHHTLDREYSRSRNFSQLTNERWVHAELAPRYLREQDNLFAWAPIPLFVERPDYRCLDLALIQEWQPRLNYPFICPFFHSRKGIPQASHAHQCPTRAGHLMASCQTQVHSKGDQRHPGIGQISKLVGTLDHCSWTWLQHQSQI